MAIVASLSCLSCVAALVVVAQAGLSGVADRSPLIAFDDASETPVRVDAASSSAAGRVVPQGYASARLADAPSAPITERRSPDSWRRAQPNPTEFAVDAPRYITSWNDITGGRDDGLFGDYSRQRAAQRDEAGYRTSVLQKGERLDELLRRSGYDAADASAASSALQGVLSGRRLPAGSGVDIAGRPAIATPFEIASGTSAYRLDRVRLFPEPGREIVAWRDGARWQVREDAKPVTVGYVTAASVMTDSLFGAGARAEIPREVMARLANLFLYDVDFARDVRRGDRFEVVWEDRRFDDGSSAGTGAIVFAAMSWRGGRYAKGYYRASDPETGDALYVDASGASARRLLMKTPIDGARVTSRFGPRRHPTLGYTKAHKGVDFGARSGTPIMAAGDGDVVRAGRLGSYGNFLLIRHANGFETAYAHLKGFADGVKKGARVRQGEVVAFVGTTGRSTGPHLHYEVRADGRPVNPMDLDVATDAVLVGDALAAFQRERARIDGLRTTPTAIAAGGASSSALP